MNMLSTGKQLTEKLLNAMISLQQDKSKSDRIKILQFKENFGNNLLENKLLENIPN